MAAQPQEAWRDGDAKLSAGAITGPARRRDRDAVPGEPMSGMRASAWGEAPSAERGDVGLE